jgi:ABC-2 type transport system permease protein
MNVRRLLSIVRKEFRQLFRDRENLRLFVIAPLIQLVMFGYAVSTDLKGVRVGVVMEDRSPEARRMLQAVEQSQAFEIVRTDTRPEDARRWLDRGEADVSVHIPPGFSRALADGRTPAIQVLSDGSDSNTATLAYQYLSGASNTWAVRERVERMRRHPEGAERLVGTPRVQVESRFWYNPDLKSVNYQIPGVLGLIALVLTLMQTSLMVVKERELGTLEQLTVTPIRPVELLVGKTVPVAVLGWVLTGAITFVAWSWFRVPLRGSLPFLFLAASLFLLNTMGLGLLLSVVSRTQMQAQLLANFLSTPLILLSGFMFPIANMPDWAQWLTYAMPTRYYMEIVRGVFLKGQGLAELWPQAQALGLLGAALYTAGILSFRKQAD